MQMALLAHGPGKYLQASAQAQRGRTAMVMAQLLLPQWQG